MSTRNVIINIKMFDSNNPNAISISVALKFLDRMPEKEETT